jgi:hypothetical protein
MVVVELCWGKCCSRHGSFYSIHNCFGGQVYVILCENVKLLKGQEEENAKE